MDNSDSGPSPSGPLNQEEQNKLIDSHNLALQDKFDEMRKVMLQKIKDEDLDESFYICNLKSIRERISLWKQILPRVDLFYAAKCNPDVRVLEVCVEQGINFDVASVGEMQELIKMGCTGNRMIFANPVKVKKQLNFARENDVKMMTFDSAEELKKIQNHFP